MRSTAETVENHVRTVNTGVLDDILRDYSQDAVLLTPLGAFQGAEAVEGFFSQALGVMPQVQIALVRTVAAGDSLAAWWTARYAGGQIDDGVDTFTVKDGLIALHSASFTMQPAPAT